MTNIIIGASSEIGKALAQQLIAKNLSKLVLISRSMPTTKLDRKIIQFIQVNDYSEQSIKLAISELKSSLSDPVTKVFICNGILQNGELKPEKKIEDFRLENFHKVLQANTITPMLWLQHLVPIISGDSTCKLVVFSARVGSISDNTLGAGIAIAHPKPL
ncbi:SDR family NAD(P)-dependent oxidoreductase [Paraglaciecola aquimarina]|uniref:SDR family NAD(P)-dependent oxidoreductase n=1 Tax=Paraglaciecola aquimarina TaxID=1235557 RepID=A0ABU3SYI3_9ALTE|nr:SDR family NAD(P)-dependent oxidoreductase [Paraglaciecola aquimarina]MDU0355072.1 SDR family NAD(P)-dependent oxidoreductase [Paraglaciecola aquimarina]